MTKTRTMQSSLGVMALAIALAMLQAEASQAWPGYDWNKWKEVSQARKPEFATPQGGLREMLPLLKTEASNGEVISSSRGWEEKRAGIYHTLEALLGSPSAMRVDPPGAKVLGEEDLGDHVRRHLLISGETDDPIPAYLLIPKPAPQKPSATMIVLHQTQAPGKQEAVGMTGNPEMKFALELARRGFVVCAYDAIGFGERIPPGGKPYDGAMKFYERHTNWSFFGKMAWDFRRVVDYLETEPLTDPRRIGTIGHSHGAYGSIICSIMEPRIAATVASCGFTIMRTDPNPERWSHLTALFPSLGFYVGDVASLPTDWHEIISLLAPRPYYNFSTLDDEIFPKTDNLQGVFGEVSEVYGLYGRRDNFRWDLVPGAHKFPIEYREKAYAWLEKILK